MKKITKLFIALISVGMLLSINVNAESVADKWYTSSDTEKTKEVKKEALEKIEAAIPDTINVNVKEIDAVNGYDYDTELNDVGKYINEQVNKAIKDAGITLPMKFETTDDDGNKVEITIGENGLYAGVVPYILEWEGDKLNFEFTKNLSTAIVELNVTTSFSWGGSDIVKTLKTIDINYSDSNKRTEADQKYVDNAVKNDIYMFYEVSELNLETYGHGDEEDIKRVRDKIISNIKQEINDNTLEFKSFFPGSHGGLGDFDFGFEDWILVVYKNGIAYKIIQVATVTTVKITVPNTVPNTEKGYIDYVNKLFQASSFADEMGKVVSIKAIDDINNRFTDGYNIPDNKGYYLFGFDGENKIDYAFKIVRENPITSVKLNKTSLNLVKGKSEKLTVTTTPSDTTDDKALTWTSSNTKVATVDKNGVVKGIKAGTATITVKTSNGKTASVKVTVKKATPIKSVKLNKSSAKLELNKTLQLKATISPSNTTDDKTLTWSSSNKKVVTVDQNGKITAIKAGTAKITVKTSNGKKKTITVTVSKINAKKAKITAIANQVQTGKAIKPTVEVKLNGIVLKSGTDYTVSYKNNKNAGKATVTVKFKGNYTGSVKSTFLIIPKKVSIKNTSTTKKAITVKYSKVSGAKTYQIAYRVKGTDKWTYVKNTTASKKINKLTSGKEYEVMVRAGIKNGSKTLYGSWSDVKTIKVK